MAYLVNTGTDMFSRSHLHCGWPSSYVTAALGGAKFGGHQHHVENQSNPKATPFPPHG